MAHQYNPSDLTSVLNTLSTLTNPISIPPNANHNDTHHDPSPDHNHDDYDPYEPPEPIHPQPPAPAAPTPKHLDNTPKPRPRSDDPSTITTWPPALRHVMHTMSQNEALQRKIRRLLHNQHSHERNWWDGREALVRKQVARAEKKRELDAVLMSVGAPVDSSKEVSTEEENAAELKNYDDKVYRASVDMADALVLELRGLGIPFFAIKRDLIDSSKAATPTIPRRDLETFQRRMLELLQDLCKE